jgi:hypothetical protein
MILIFILLLPVLIGSLVDYLVPMMMNKMSQSNYQLSNVTKHQSSTSHASNVSSMVLNNYSLVLISILGLVALVYLYHSLHPHYGGITFIQYCLKHIRQ